MGPEEKRRIIEKRILGELQQYLIQHKSGITMQILSAKYSKACVELGGFPDVIERMRMAGLIHVNYSIGGARTVSVGQGLANSVNNLDWY